MLSICFFADYIRPICIAQSNDSNNVNDTVVGSGWGLESNSKLINEIFMQNFMKDVYTHLELYP